MKKFLTLLACFAMVFVLSACGSNKDAEAAQNVVNEYFTYCKDGDFTSADALVNPDSDDVDLFDESFDTGLDSMSELGMKQETIEEWKDMFKGVLTKCFKSWEFDESTVDGDTATVIVKLTGINEDKIDTVLNFDFGETTATQWAEAHESEIAAYLENNPSEEAFISWLFEQITPMVRDEIDKQMGELKDETKLYKFELKKVDGSWLIDNIMVEAED